MLKLEQSLQETIAQHTKRYEENKANFDMLLAEKDKAYAALQAKSQAEYKQLFD